MRIRNLLTYDHLHASIDDDDLVETGMADVVVHIDRVGIAAHLGLCLLGGNLNLGIRRMALQVFQLNDIRMLHIRENLMARTEENVGITTLIVQFGDGTVEAALAGQGKGIAMHESLALLPVTLGGKRVDAVSHVLEEGFEVTIVCHVLLQLANPVGIGFQVILVVVVEKVGIDLLAYHLVGDDKLGFSSVKTTDSHHSEVVEQADEVVILGYVFSRETSL